MLKSRKFYYFIFVFGALYVLLIQQFFKNEYRFVLQSPAYNNEIPYTFNVDFQELNLPINQNISLHGIWFKQQNSKAIILLFPDSDEDLRDFKIEENYYYNSGFDVLFATYRSTARSTGNLENEADLFSDAQHWYNFSKSQFPEKNIVVAGQGFGASVAAQLAGNNKAKALIINAPRFAYGAYYAKSRFWFLPYNHFTSFPLKTWEYVRKTQSEIILIQNEETTKDADRLSKYLKDGDLTIEMEASEAASDLNLKLKNLLISISSSQISSDPTN